SWSPRTRSSGPGSPCRRPGSFEDPRDERAPELGQARGCPDGVLVEPEVPREAAERIASIVRDVHAAVVAGVEEAQAAILVPTAEGEVRQLRVGEGLVRGKHEAQYEPLHRVRQGRVGGQVLIQ